MPKTLINPKTQSVESTLQLTLTLPETKQEEAIAILNQWGWEAFEELPDQLIAYRPENTADIQTIEKYLAELGISKTDWSFQVLAPKNYNQIWEEGLNPVKIENWVQVIPGNCIPEDGFEQTLYITPQMSFGTGHHSTTRMRMLLMREINWSDKVVVDLGTGTGILGILAAKLGASSVLGIDIEPWCTENAIANAALNHTASTCTWVTGDAHAMNGKPTNDVVLANLNRNLIIENLSALINNLQPSGHLLISGFYTEDLPILESHFIPLGWKVIHSYIDKNWVAALLTYSEIK